MPGLKSLTCDLLLIVEIEKDTDKDKPAAEKRHKLQFI
jgi:hypothetical protein